MKVVQSDGIEKLVNPFDILTRLKEANEGLNCDLQLICNQVCTSIYGVVTDSQLNELLAETAASMDAIHPHYASLAARFSVLNLRKGNVMSFSETITYMNSHSSGPVVADDVYDIILKNSARLNGEIKHERDFYYDYLGVKTLERSYLWKIDGNVVESPQYMIMRVAVGIHKKDIDSVIETYNLMSQGWFIHASPTLFNAATPNSQLSSCFLVCMENDSFEGIYGTLNNCVDISKSGGGIGLSIHNMKSTGTYIRGPNKSSDGIVPMLRVFNETARYVDEQGGRRKGAFTVYLEPWHKDIHKYLDLRKKHGKEEHRARDLFYALWIPDLFMKRVKNNGSWSLFCPSEAPELADSWGQKFEELYTKYEEEKKATQNKANAVNASDLWREILKSQIETGTPYLLFKDACNGKSNQQNLGTIKGSSLRGEIIQYTSPTETAVCNLASIALPRFVRQEGSPAESLPSKLVGSPKSDKRYFDLDKLAEITSVVTKNLNKTIDENCYPVETAKKFGNEHRPIGIGVQGLADTFILLGYPYDSPEARNLNKQIFETIYYNALKTSCLLAQDKKPYGAYSGSRVSVGILQPELWAVKTNQELCDWNELRKMIATNGVRNSVLVALMPTSSTSQILGNNESFAPYSSNIRRHKVLRAQIPMLNKHLLHDLHHSAICSSTLKNQIIIDNGSVQGIPTISDRLKDIYKTAWEINQKTLIDMAVDRGCYIDQSQSLNIYMDQPNIEKLHELHFHAWSQGLKTGMCCLQSQNAVVYLDT